MLDWIIEGIRVLIWGLTSACLRLMDVCYDIVIEVASADFLGDSQVWGWYYATMAFIAVLIGIRTAALFFKFAFDEEYRDKLNITHFFNKITAIALVMILLPHVLGYTSKVAVWGMQNTSIILGSSNNTKPSTFIITAFMNTDNGEYTVSGHWVTNDKVTYTLDDVDINEDGEGDADYKFFDDIGELFMVAIIGIAAAVMLIMNAVQIGKRSYGLVMKLIVAPIPISSLIVPGDETFSLWRKMIVSDYLLNFFQTLMIMIVMILAGSKVLTDVSVWAQIISFIAGLLMLLSGVPELSKILGGDTSQAGVLQQIASFRMATAGVGRSISSKFDKVAGVAKTAGAGGAYGAGRLLGGKSMNQIGSEAKNKANGSDGFMGGSEVNENPNGLASAPKQENSNNQNLDNATATNKSGDSVNAPSSVDNRNDQTLGTNSNNSEANNLFSQDGKTPSALGVGTNNSEGAASEAGRNSALGTGNAFAAGKNLTGVAASAQTNQDISYARDKSIAGKFNAQTRNAKGVGGVAANLAKNSSRHMYQSSMNRIERSRAYRTAGSIKKLASPSMYQSGGD